MHQQHKVTQTWRDFEFGLGGPYRLDLSPGSPLRNCARAFMHREATRLDCIRTRAELLLDGKPTANVDALLERLNEEMIHAEAALRRAMYGGNRWSVVVVEDRYVFLTRPNDAEGHAREPWLVTGDIGGLGHCPTCLGVGRTASLREGTPTARCPLCRGKGRIARQLPAAVRDALLRHEAASLASVAVEEPETVEVEVVAHAD